MSHPTGWIDSPQAVEQVLEALPRPFFSSAAGAIAGSGEGKTALLYRAVYEVNGAYVADPGQTIGCCVGRGFASSVDHLACVEIAIGKEPESFVRTSHEAIYGLSREIGNFLAPVGRDGSVGAWAAKAVSQFGTVGRDVVGDYSDQRAGEWGWKGVPKAIKDVLGKHKVRTASLVKTWEEGRDAIANGYPIAVCSNVGFEPMKRDAQGFCKPGGRWDHCMCFVGLRADRPGLLCMNSWGMTVPTGPTAMDQPGNTFWVDAMVVDRMLKQGDSWALSSFDGYPGKRLPSRWSWMDLAA